MSTVSVIIPIYNLEKKLLRCLDSVILQSYRDLQIILVDDGSSDLTAEICSRYAQLDSRILFLQKSNGGVSSARNLGLQKAVGDYVMFIDGDDEVAADYVENYVGVAAKELADVVVGGQLLIEGNHTHKKMPRPGRYCLKSFIEVLCEEGTDIYGYAYSKLIKRELIEHSSVRFNETMHSQEDLDFSLSIYPLANCICCIEDCGYHYYHEPSNRVIPPKHLLGNQIKLFQAAKSIGANTVLLIPRVQRILYTLLYHAESSAQIRQLAEIQIPEELITRCPESRQEIQLLISSFRRKEYTLIYLYFRIRGIVKNLKDLFHKSRI